MATAPLELAAEALDVDVPPRSEWRRAWVRFQRNRFALGGLVFLCFLVVIAVAAPLIAPHGYADTDYSALLKPELSPGHVLGTDELGRDVLSRVLYSLRTALMVAFGAELTALVLALAIGLTAGYVGGRRESFLMAVTDVMYAFPSYLFAIVLVTVVGRSLVALAVAIGVASWVTQARLIRAQTKKLKVLEFVEAGRAMGAGSSTIALRYILPNAVGPILVAVSFGIPAAITVESGLALLGLGVAPPTPSWGTMIAEGTQFVLAAPHLLIWPLSLFALTMLAFTWVGDGVRDAFDVSGE